MTQQTDNKVLQAIASTSSHKFYDVLAANESAIDWLGFATKLYRKSESASTITTYCYGITRFREMLAQAPYNMTLSDALLALKQKGELQAGLKTKTLYKVLDDFVSYCVSKEYRPRTTKKMQDGVIALLKYEEFTIDQYKVKSIEMPTAKALNDEYPPDSEIKAIDTHATLTVRGFRQVINDAGFEPIDAAQLKVKQIKFDEDIPRIVIEREKTGELLTGFLGQTTADTLKAIIHAENKQPDDYLFTSAYSAYTVGNLSEQYNLAVAKAGFYKLVVSKDSKGFTRKRAKVEAIDGHVTGKYHLKVYKKRWFTLSITAGVPEYVAQGMLGRKKYLDQYLRLPVEMKQDFARKILEKVDVYAPKVDDTQKRKAVANVLGLDDLTPEQMTKLREKLFRMLDEPSGPLPKALSESEAI